MIIGIGVDIIEIRRIRRVLDRFPRRFTGRVFTPHEREFCANRSDPAPCLAARFAAKEAFAKALGAGISQGIRFSEMEVFRETGTPPEMRVTGRAGEVARRLGVSKTHISISHGEDAAIAFVVIEGPGE